MKIGEQDAAGCEEVRKREGNRRRDMQENGRPEAIGPTTEEQMTAAAHERQVVIPVVVEEAVIQVQEVERGSVRVQKHVEQVEETIDLPVTTESVTVERVPINAWVEGDAPQMREEDGVIVIPVLEEVLVVEKRLLLREEVRLTRRTATSTSQQTVTLRRETVDVERTSRND